MFLNEEWIFLSESKSNIFIFQLFRAGGKSNEITVKCLIEFLNEKQRDPRLNEILYPHYNENRVMEIIRTYEKNPVLVEKGLISKEVNVTYVLKDILATLHRYLCFRIKYVNYFFFSSGLNKLLNVRRKCTRILGQVGHLSRYGSASSTLLH